MTRAERKRPKADNLGHVGREGETENLQRFVLFAQDAEIVIELVVFLHQFITIVCNARRTIGLTGFFHYGCKVGKFLNEFLPFRREDEQRELLVFLLYVLEIMETMYAMKKSEGKQPSLFYRTYYAFRSNSCRLSSFFVSRNS